MTADKKQHDAASSREAYRLLFDFQWKSLTQTLELATKGIGFYFLLLLASIGAIYQSKMQGAELRIAVAAVVAISILFSPILIFFSWGILKGLDDLQASLRRICPVQFDEVAMERYFQRGRITARVAAACCVLILAVVIISVTFVQFR